MGRRSACVVREILCVLVTLFALQAHAAVDTAQLQAAPASVTFTLANAKFNRKSGQLTYTGTLANGSSEAIAAPLFIVLENFSDPSVRVISANDVTTVGDPVLIVNQAVAPGARTTLPVVLSSRNRITFVARVYLPVTNRPPVFDALEPVRLNEGEQRTISVRATDPDQDQLTLTAGALPAFVTEGEQSDGAIQFILAPTFTDSGNYNTPVMARDDQGATADTELVVEVINVNRPPQANAGADQFVGIGNAAALDGSASSDPDLENLAFSWTITQRPDGSNATLTDELTATPTLQTDLAGAYHVTLTVTDPFAASSADTVIVTARAGNTAPRADAGDDQQVAKGALVQLNGSGSRDADQDELSYRWTLALPPGSSASLMDETSVTPSFVADVAGTFRATLVVNDSEVDSAPDEVDVLSAQAPNQAPVITSDPLTDGAPNVDYRYDVEATDEEPATLTYGLTTSPAGMSIDASSGLILWTPTLQQVGDHSVSVSVRDLDGLSVHQSFIVQVMERGRPVALDDTYSVSGNGQPLDVAAPGVLENDSDADSTQLTALLRRAPSNGSVALREDGSFSYAPHAIGPGREVTVDGVNLATAIPGTSFSATSFFVYSGGLGVPGSAFDDRLGTSWNGSFGLPQTLSVRFPTDVRVAEVQVYGHRVDSLANGNGRVKTGRVELRDASGTILFDSGRVELTGAFRDLILTLSNEIDGVREVRFIGLESDKTTGFPAPGLAEMRVLGATTLTRSTAPAEINLFQLLAASAVATSTAPFGWTPELAINGTDTPWWANGNDERLDLTLPVGATVTRIVVKLPIGLRPDGFGGTFNSSCRGNYQLLDDAGNVLFDTGEVVSPRTFGSPSQDEFTVPNVSGVKTLRYEQVPSSCNIFPPGFREIEMFGTVDGGLDVAQRELTLAYQADFREEVHSTPLVGQFTDDNGDGAIDGNDMPDIVAIVEAPTNELGGFIRVVSGDDGHLIWTAGQPDSVGPWGNGAIGDLDGDGLLEVVVPHKDGNKLLAFEHNGTLKWTSTVNALPGNSPAGNPTGGGGAVLIANLDGVGLPEVIVGSSVYSATGQLLGDGRSIGGTSGGGSTLKSAMSVVADIDLDGQLELIAGPTAYRFQNNQLTVVWSQSALGEGFASVANLDDDAFGEIVLVGNGVVRVLNHDGSEAISFNNGSSLALPGNGTLGEGGPATIADFDADGEPEIGVATFSTYSVFERDGSLGWSSPTLDASSSTGSTVFDFDNDGAAEVIYRDEKFLRIYRGSDGVTLVKEPIISSTWIEDPVIADVNNDGHADLLVTSDASGSSVQGLYVFTDIANQWPRTRPLWNQSAYSISNVNEDGTIPNYIQPNWLIPGLNNFRLNTFPPNEDRGDVFTYVASDGTNESNEAEVRISILGANSPPTITSGPDSLLAAVGVPYRYIVAANDPDVGDVLTFSLLDAPIGMTMDARTGVLDWLPAADQLGSHAPVIRVEDSKGYFSLQAIGLTVTDPMEVPNLVGKVGSCPAIVRTSTALPNQPYRSFADSPFANLVSSYFHLEDLEDGVFSLPGLTISTRFRFFILGRLGDFNINVNSVDADDGAIDGNGSGGHNGEFSAGPNVFSFNAATLGRLPTHVGIVHTFGSVTNGAQIIAIDGLGRALSPTVSAADMAAINVNVHGHTASDRFFGFTSPFGIASINMNYPVHLDHLQYGFCDGADVALFATNLLVGSVTEEHSSSVPAGQVIRQFPSAGALIPKGEGVAIVVSLGRSPLDNDDDGDGFSENQGDCDDANPDRHPNAVDIPANGVDEDCSGTDAPNPINVDNDLDGFTEAQGDCDDVNAAIHPNAPEIPDNGIDENCDGRDGDSADQEPPIALILEPLEAAEVTAPTPVFGVINDDNLADYRLELALVGESATRVIASGSDPIVNAEIATLDPTLLENGLYRLRLAARDSNGLTSIDERVFRVDGEMKVGPMQIAFVDLQVPLAGIPITVIRSYDSRIKAQRDFGIGWELDIKAGKYQNNRAPGLGWTLTKAPGPFGLPCQIIDETQTHFTEVRLSDREVYRFKTVLNNPTIIVGGCLADAGFEFVDGPLPGARLEVIGESEVLYTSGEELSVFDGEGDTGLLFDPRRVRLSLPDGRVIDLDSTSGITRIADPNGNSIRIDTNGITHSSGRSIAFQRDAAGRITQITDPRGNRLQYRYDDQADLVEFTNQTGDTTSFAYDGDHNLLNIIDPLGNQALRAEYDGDGRLIALIDAKGNRTEFTHNIDGREELTVDARGNPRRITYNDRGYVNSSESVVTVDGQLTTATTNYVHDARGNELEVVDADGVKVTSLFDTSSNVLESVVDADGLRLMTRYTYESHGEATSLTNPEGETIGLSYDPSGNLTAFIDPMGRQASFVVDTRGVQTSGTDPLGVTTRNTIDGFGRLTQQEVVDALGNSLRRETYTYDANGNSLTETLFRSVNGVLTALTTRFSYDATNRLVAVTDPLGNVVRTEYNGVGKVAAQIDALGRRTEFVYDEVGALIETQFPDGTSEVREYDEVGNLVRLTGAGGHVTEFAYDELNREIERTTPAGLTLRTSYTAAGRVLATMDPLDNRTDFIFDTAGRQIATFLPSVLDAETNALVRPELRLNYDGADRLLSFRDPNGQVTEYEYEDSGRRIGERFADGTTRQAHYDALGRLIESIDEEGRSTRFVYDGLARLIRVIDANNEATHYVYDQANNLVQQTDALGRVTRYEYDALNRLIAKVLPDGKRNEQRYDAVGNVVERRDFAGEIYRFAYDERNRLISAELPDQTTVAYTYTATGNRDTVTDRRGVTQYSYDGADRLIAITHPNGQQLTYSYDAAGRLASITHPADSMSYDYDALDRLTQLTSGAGTTSYGYDLASNLVTTAAPNGVQSQFEHDVRNRLTQVSHRAGGNLFSNFNYQLTPTGRRQQVTDVTGATENYGYDPLYRLTSASRNGANPFVLQFAYDEVGNRVQQNRNGVVTGYSYDLNDQLTTAGDISYSYDDNGNLVAKNTPSGTTAYQWGPNNTLEHASGSFGTVSFDYDADGNLIERIHGSDRRSYLVDTNNLTGLSQTLLETSAQGEQLSFAYGRTLQHLNNNGTSLFAQHDGLGSVRTLTDNTGQLSDAYRFEPFGDLAARFGTSTNPFGFVGERLDEELGFIYLRARFYDPETGRMVGRDPFDGVLENPLTRNPYLYAINDPLNRFDPTGLFSIGEISVSLSIQSVLRGLSEVGGRTAQVCRAKGFIAAAEVFAIGNALYSFAASQFEDAIPNQPFDLTDPKSSVSLFTAELKGKRGARALKKFDVRLGTNANRDRLFQINAELGNGSRIPVEINTSDLRKSSVGIGLNFDVPITEISPCAVDLAKVAFTFRVKASSELLDESILKWQPFRFALEFTLFDTFRTSWPIFPPTISDTF